MTIHASAIVEDGARVGADVEIGPFCHIGPAAELQDGVRLHSHVCIRGRTNVGSRSIVHSGAVLGGEGQIRNNDFVDAQLLIGPDCVIRESVTMNCGSREGGGITRVGARGYFMACSHVGHDCQVGSDVTFANGATLGGHVQIGDGVIFGGLSAVQQRGRVGKGAMIGGITGVNRDVIPYGIAFGAHVELAGLNLIGLARRGLTRDAINAMRAAFRGIFLRDGGSIAERARAARETWTNIPEIDEIVQFILADAHQPLCTARRSRIGTSEQ